MQESISVAQATGKSLAEWRASLLDVMQTRGWVGSTDWHLETVFRTNMQSAYGRGRLEQARAVINEFPYWMYIAVNDTRSRPSHLALNGRVWAADSEFWKVHYPPWGYNCRCSVEIMLADEVKGMKIETDEGPEQEGDFTSPAQGAWTPDLLKYPPSLRAALEAKLLDAPSS